MLEAVGDFGPTVIEGWRERVARARAWLGWPHDALVARRHARGVSLALAAPLDQLYTATEVNEWALCATLAELDPAGGVGLVEAMHAALLEDAADPADVVPPVLEETAALARLKLLSAREARPRLRALVDAALARGLPYLLDDEALTLGAGGRGRSFGLAALPDAAGVAWGELGDVPTALVTGSNGKTTTVRLIAACMAAHGLASGYNCTDGVYVAGVELDAGDYSGPAGARLVLRDPRTQAAILETARGGILRRGIAVSRADVAVVTNVSSDHFGEYGIDDLVGLADVKLSVAGVVRRDGLLIVNADDGLLCARARALESRYRCAPALALFARDFDSAALQAHRAQGGSAAGVRDGRLLLTRAGVTCDLGAVASFPLSMGGSAHYNVANLAAAALVSRALGASAATIGAVYARFGDNPRDNYGRLMRYSHRGATVLVDYAHNPDGLAGLLAVAQHLRAPGARLALILGHAGNRQDADIEALAHVAARARPDYVVVKENEAQLRGRAPGELPRLLHAALLGAGLAPESIALRMGEALAARAALDWARAGDVVVLPMHGRLARAEVVAMLEEGA